MKTIELIGDVDEGHRLQAQVPSEVPAGPVRLFVVVQDPKSPDEDLEDLAWMHGVAGEWAEELSDPREDIYTLDDGQPIHAAR